MRYAKRTDDNHAEVVRRIHELLPECSILDLSGAGNGVPDLVIGHMGKNIFIEIKDPTKPASKRCLTPAQEKLHTTWKGQIDVAHSAIEAVEIIYMNTTPPKR